jgi:phage terminase large subunit-like protein
MVSNCSIEEDAAGNIKPSKKKSTERIDGVVGLTMAIGRVTMQAGEYTSIYETENVKWV